MSSKVQAALTKGTPQTQQGDAAKKPAQGATAPQKGKKKGEPQQENKKTRRPDGLKEVKFEKTPKYDAMRLERNKKARAERDKKQKEKFATRREKRWGTIAFGDALCGMCSYLACKEEPSQAAETTDSATESAPKPMTEEAIAS